MHGNWYVTPGADASYTLANATPGSIIGFRKDGRPIRLAAGGSQPTGSGDAGGAADSGGSTSTSSTGGGTFNFGGGDSITVTGGGVNGGGDGDNAGVDDAGIRTSGRNDANDGQGAAVGADGSPAVPAPAADPAADTDPDADPTDWAVDQLPAGAQQLIADLRKEAGDNRHKTKAANQAVKDAEARVTDVENKLAGFLDGFANVLGLTTAPDGDGDEADGDTKDPAAEIANRLTQVQDAQREQQIELHVWKQSASLGARPDELLDSREFMSKVKALDPTGDDFAQEIASVVADTVKGNPARFAIAAPAAPTAPAPSGAQFAGGPGQRTDINQMSVDDFRNLRKKASAS